MWTSEEGLWPVPMFIVSFCELVIDQFNNNYLKVFHFLRENWGSKMQDLFFMCWQYIAQLILIAFFEKIVILVMQHLVVFLQLCFWNFFLKCLEYLLETASIKFSSVPLAMKTGTLLPSSHCDIIDPVRNLQSKAVPWMPSVTHLLRGSITSLWLEIETKIHTGRRANKENLYKIGKVMLCHMVEWCWFSLERKGCQISTPLFKKLKE